MSLTLRSKLLMVAIAAAATYLWWPGDSPVLPPASTKAAPRPKPVMTAPLEAIDPPPVTAPPPTIPPTTPPISNQPTAPRPDPFTYAAQVSPETAAAAHPTLSPSATLTLQGIAIDNGKCLAVINRRIVAAGDSIEGWRVERIESGRVWMRTAAAAAATATATHTAAETVILEFNRTLAPAR
jgi:hypothetical protein